RCSHELPNPTQGLPPRQEGEAHPRCEAAGCFSQVAPAQFQKGQSGKKGKRILNWVCLRTSIHPRSEFTALHALNQREHQAIVPFEEKWVRRGNTKQRQLRKYPLFPRYCFAAFADWIDYDRSLREINDLATRMGKAPPILGAISKIGSAEPAK